MNSETPAAVVAQLLDKRRDPVVTAGDVKPTFRRAFFAALRHEAHGVGPMHQRDIEHL